MTPLHIALLIGLVFALFVFLLLVVSLCKSNSNNPEDDESSPSYLEAGRFGGSNRNNNNIGQLEQETEPLTTLPSRPSAPLLTEIGNGVIRRATSRQSVNSQRNTEDLRAIQSGLLRNGFVGTTSNSPDSQFNLIIGVDAQPAVFGGYCVNLMEGDGSQRWAEFYSILREDLPWRLSQDVADTELESKNFLFALMLWGEAIVEAKRILIYTGNQAVVYENNRYGRRATKLMEHYSQCDGVIIGNDCRFLVNWNKEPKSYAEHILPAEDLSSGLLREFHDFISQYYEIELDNFSGTHYIPPFVRQILIIKYLNRSNFQQLFTA